MRLLLHTALLATAAIAAPAPHPDCGRGGYNSWGGDASTCAEVDTNRGRGAYNEWDESSKKSANADTNGGRGAYNEWDEASKRSADVDTNSGRGAYNGWDEKSKISANVEPNTGRGAYNGLDGDFKKSANADTNGGRGAYNGWDEIAKSSSVDTNGGRGAYNEVQENSKRSADADKGRGAYNGWDEDSEDSSFAETNGGRGAYNGWDGDSKESSYADFGRRWHRGRDSQRGSCDLRNAVMPAAPIALPPPAAGLTLGHVAIGRGNQNYTCDLSNSTAVPVAAGAVATLFNVSCLAADMPELLSRLCPIALDLPIPSSSDTSSPIYQGMSGHHYFKDATTPYFDLDTGAHRYGTGAFKKGDSTPAPATAMAGPYNSGNGPVAWLRLDAKTTTDGQVFKEVYRLNTAGGQPPKTCEGMPAAFEVPYAAEYWLFQ